MSNTQVKLYDYEPNTSTQLDEVIAGLKKDAKELPSKLFYDEHGSILFDQITELEEYYPTRTELSIMEKSIADIERMLGENCLLIEYGSGSSKKTKLLLDHLTQLVGYVPIDISKEHLYKAATRIAKGYPDLEVLPVCADYTQEFKIPEPETDVSRRIVYFPGSTIGNFHANEAADFLARMREMAKLNGAVLIGVDRKKDTALLHAAYNDREGITAEFNLNILRRLNQELGADFKVEQFDHDAIYNEELGRIEMHLVSQVSQSVRLNDSVIHFDAGESIWTEFSYKYSPDEFTELAGKAGLRVARFWTDADDLFAVYYLVVR